ncbi:hypothetical protein [Massilibacteroides sp.]|uniref:hypothetical protein n=1 Tax=Massilibacteroides sp. TaxID=2034766 RepID=UPI0026256885|nr:hypothetical protein [Massilibacteroides sp.]MDD4514831.1 hypothetical protein [Massilibacteroides sp.]
MNSEHQKDTNQEWDKTISKLKERSHLVFLGAGATMAAILNGDKNGNKCSVMNNFLEELNLLPLIDNCNIKTTSQNLEDIYSELYERKEYVKVRKTLEKNIFDYFSKLRLPDKATIYDYLILCLTKKDLIATFNWDPLLIEAYNRVIDLGFPEKKLPRLAFLHGNVSAGICPACKNYGHIESHCKKCGLDYVNTKLLFPIKKKNYSSDEFIYKQWQLVKKYIDYAGIITFFGYSAPESDIDAMDLIRSIYNKENNGHRLDRIEIIDIADQNKLWKKWGNFYHIDASFLKITDSFWKSYITKFPRATVKRYVESEIESPQFIGPSIIPMERTLTELKTLFDPFIY